MQHLVLVPTPIELQLLKREFATTPENTVFDLCGFGVAAAGVLTLQLINTYQPERVSLVGIAGSYDIEHLVSGQAYEFDSVSMYGIGAGSGSTFSSPRDLGIPQFQSTTGENVFDTIHLNHHGKPLLRLLTVASCTNHETEAEERLRRFPEVAAEDMEGFAVATACAVAQKPLTIIRGISNQVGIRDKKFWQIEQAIQSAAALLKSKIDN